MDIQIIGMGIVGKAQAKVMQKLGHEVIGCDVRAGSFDGIQINEKPSKDADLTFICAPEKVVPVIIANLVNGKVHNPYVIKSTVPPGTTRAAMLKHGVHICHNPEFLREETFIEDALNQKFVIIGECCKEHGDMLAKVYEPMDVKIIRTDPDASEMAKLALNNYLATLITFWNEVDKICNVLGLNTNDIAGLVKQDERVSEYGTAFFGRPFNGKCLPKDLDQTIMLCRSKGLPINLFETIKEVNTELQVLNTFGSEVLFKNSEKITIHVGNK